MKQGEQIIAIKSNCDQITVTYSKEMGYGNHKVFCMEEKRYMSMVTLRDPLNDFECKPINQVNLK